MATSELIEALQALAHERKIDEFYLIERLEQSLAKSYERILDLEWDARVTIDRQTGKIYVYELVPVGEPDEETGEYSEFEERDVTPDDVSRIAAQNAKGVISSLVREAGRQSIYDEFRGRVGDLVTGTVLQGTPDFTIIKIRDGVEAELPHYDVKRNPGERNERPANEHYRHNQRLKVLIIEVRNPNADAPRARGEQARPAIVVSRTHPDLIRRLFEIEVPEIYEGVVEIKSVAREPGARSKVAVFSREANLDPVGACVGPKGSRVRMVVEELRNERVDVIQWSPDPAVYVANALSPAKVSHVSIDEDNNYATVIVPDDQLSLAIGKEGQNARLAARLTGWHIDIKPQSFQGASLVDVEMDDEVEEDDGFCIFVDEDGNRCRNHARPNSQYCGVHADAEAEAKGQSLMAVQTTKRQRTCIGCGATLGKGALHRIVRNGEGLVSFDPTGRLAGRGAYVCSEDCLAASRKTRKLERALRCKVTDEDYERVLRELALAEAPGKNEE